MMAHIETMCLAHWNKQAMLLPRAVRINILRTPTTPILDTLVGKLWTQWLKTEAWGTSPLEELSEEERTSEEEEGNGWRRTRKKTREICHHRIQGKRFQERRKKYEMQQNDPGR